MRFPKEILFLWKICRESDAEESFHSRERRTGRIFWKELSWTEEHYSIFRQILYSIRKQPIQRNYSGNPHAFDLGTTDGKILYQVVEKDLEVRGLTVDESKLFPAYKRQRSYLAAGILLDDVSNYALLYNVQAIKRDGALHMGMDGFGKENEMVQVPLGVIAEWKEIRCPQKEIYIVENPSVFAMLCGKSDKEQKNNNCFYMCMNGQPRLSCLIVLDLLAKIGTTVYYAGDLDPEGMLIAQKLSTYYKGKFHFWHMGLEDYRKCRSDEAISAKRMKSLEKITDERLLPVKEEIEKWKVAGYQEKLYDIREVANS